MGKIFKAVSSKERKGLFISYKDSCNPHTNSEKKKPPRAYEYGADENGRDQLCVSNGKQEECYIKSDKA